VDGIHGLSGFLSGPRQDRVAQVVRSGAQYARRDDDRGGLCREPECPGREAAECPQRRPLGALPAGGGRAGLALAQVGAELGALGPRDGLVQLLRDGELGLGARERALELLPQRTTRTEDERLHRARGEAEHLGDLGVGAALDLSQDDRGTLVESQVAECAPDVLRRGRFVVGGEFVRDVVVELDLLRPTRGGPEALQAHVVRDLDQPVERRARVLSALERPVRVEERRLGDVLRVRAVAEHAVRVAIDVRRVPPVEAIERTVQAWLGRHARTDARFREKPARR
jgi:hypothetical protein